jgi:hypothetical protein
MEMKILNVLLVLVFSGCANVDYTEVPPADRSVSVVVDIPGVEKSILFSRAQEWLAINYVSSNDVTQLSNSEAGRIIGRGVTTADIDSGGLVTVPWKYSHTVQVDVRDGKARLVINNFSNLETGQPPEWKWLFNPVKASLYGLTSSFNSYMLLGGSVVEADW